VPSFLLFVYTASALLSLQLPSVAREDASNTKVDWCLSYFQYWNFALPVAEREFEADVDEQYDEF